jgi:hypothetical protein
MVYNRLILSDANFAKGHDFDFPTGSTLLISSSAFSAG